MYWFLDGFNLDFLGFKFCDKQIHKLFVSKRTLFDVNSEFAEADFEQVYKILPRGITFNLNEEINVDVIFSGPEPVNNARTFEEQMRGAPTFFKTLSCPEIGFSCAVALRGMTTLNSFRESATYRLNLYVTNYYLEQHTYDASKLIQPSRTDYMALSSVNVSRFGLISLKGNYDKLTDYRTLRVSGTASTFFTYGQTKAAYNKKDVTLKFVMVHNTPEKLIDSYINLVCFCNPVRPFTLELEHSQIDEFREANIFGAVATQFKPSFIGLQTGKSWMELDIDFKVLIKFA